MNVEKMRRYHERGVQVASESDGERWLRSLTPGHREVHAKGLPCSECMSVSLRRMADMLGRRR